MIAHLIDQYGYAILFFGTMLELILFGVPTEVIMTYTGLQVYQGLMSWGWSIAAAWLGSCIGMSASYWIGQKLGYPFFEKYGRKIHFGPERLEKASAWFERYGNKVILIAFYIPGIRHVTGYFSGITKLRFRTYAAYAYIGALVWVSVFISLGKVLGPKWETYHKAISKYLLIVCVVGVVLILTGYLFRRYRAEMRLWLVHTRDRALHRYHSLGRLRLVVVIGALALFGLASLAIGQIQDFFAKDFEEYDEIASFLIHALFDAPAFAWMSRIAELASPPAVAGIGLLIALAEWLRSPATRRLRVGMAVWVAASGPLAGLLLRMLFHRPGPAGAPMPTAWSYPSADTFILTVVYGYAAFLVLRHVRSGWTHMAVLFLLPLAAIATGIGLVRDNLAFPSDVTAGYIFGGLWLVLNALNLEILTVLREPQGTENATK